MYIGFPGDLIAQYIFRKSREGRKKKNTVYYSPIFTIFGLIGAVLGIVMIVVMLLFPNDTMQPWMLFFGMLVAACIIVVVGLRTWRITYDNVSFTYRNCLGIKRTIQYSEVTGIKRTGYTPLDEVKIYVWERHYNVYLCTVGYMEFLAELAKHVEVEKILFY